MAGRGRNPNSIQSKLQLTDADDASRSTSFVGSARRMEPPPRFPDMKIPARMGLNERDAQLVQVSIILNESYAASGYYLHPASAVASTNIAAGSAVVLGGATSVTGNSSSSSSAAAETARSSGDVDRWSDRFRLVESYSQRRLFDEGSLARRDFPPELGEMVDRTAKRRRHVIEMKQKLGRGTGANGAAAAAGVKAEPATLEERMRALERNEERGLGDDDDDDDEAAAAKIDDGLGEFEIDNIDEYDDPEYGEDDYASNYFDDGDDDGDGNAYGKDDGPTMD